jgi:hypothetical protein
MQPRQSRVTRSLAKADASTKGCADLVAITLDREPLDLLQGLRVS